MEYCTGLSAHHRTFFQWQWQHMLEFNTVMYRLYIITCIYSYLVLFHPLPLKKNSNKKVQFLKFLTKILCKIKSKPTKQTKKPTNKTHKTLKARKNIQSFFWPKDWSTLQTNALPLSHMNRNARNPQDRPVILYFVLLLLCIYKFHWL